MAKKTKRKNSKQFNKKFKKRFFTKKSILAIVLVVLIVLIITIGYVRLQKKAAQYQKEIDALSTEVKDLEKQNAALEEEIENVDTKEYKEKIAREKLGMIGKDEYSLEAADEGDSQKEADNSKKNKKK